MKQKFDKKEPELIAIDKLFSKSIKKTLKPSNQVRELIDKQNQLISKALLPGDQVRELIDKQNQLISKALLPGNQVRELIDKQNIELKKLIDKISTKHKNLVNFLK